MTLPASVRESVAAHVGPFEVRGAPSGGSIQAVARIEGADGSTFLKYGVGTAAGFFAVEAGGLRRLAGATRTMRVPEVLAFQDAAAPDEAGWLLLEWIEPGQPGPHFSERLAQGLAEIHAPAAGGWGWEEDGFIGSLPQANAPASGWPEFWRTRRIEPQLALARRSGMLPGSEKQWDELLDLLPQALAAGDTDGPSLLHGDLWGGNILATHDGDPAIIDPAPYRGHREVDLAMLDLFGSPGSDVERHYSSHRALLPGYREQRRGIYQLYYLLAHVNLFGHGYIASTAATLQSVLRAR